jgi:heme-degrading monooxygenase HmoA
MIEITTFRLAPGADDEEFKAADRRVQTQFAYRQAGLLRRTTAAGSDGDWAVISLWRDEADAEASRRRWDDDRDAGEFLSFVDRTTIRSLRFETLD